MLNTLCKRLMTFLTMPMLLLTTVSYAADTWPTCPNTAAFSKATIPYIEPDADNKIFGWSGYGQTTYNNKTWLLAIVYVQALDQATAQAKVRQALAAASETPILHKAFGFSNDCMLEDSCKPFYTCIYHTDIDPHTLIFAVDAPDYKLLKAKVRQFK
jgi:hypothetical protein